MHTKRLASRNGEYIFDYSGVKIAAGDAEIVFESCKGAPLKMHDLENSPKLDLRAKNLGVHIEISPGLNEQDDPQKIIHFAQFVLVMLGLGNQPWILARHHDITRTHYHLITTRALANGHTIHSIDLRKGLFEATEKACRKFGYSFREPDGISFPGLEHFDKNKGYITCQFRQLAEKVLEQKPESTNEFITLMRSRGVDVFLSTKTKTPKLIYSGMGPESKRNTAPVYNFGDRWKSLLELENIFKENHDEKIRRENDALHSAITPSELIQPRSTSKIGPKFIIPEPVLADTTEYENKDSIPYNDVEENLEVFPTVALPSKPAEAGPKKAKTSKKFIPTARDIALIIKDTLRDEEVWTLDLFTKACMDYSLSVISEGFQAEEMLFSFVDEDGEIIDFPSEDVLEYLSVGEVNLMRDNGYWGIKEALLDENNYKYSQKYRSTNNSYGNSY